MNRFSNISDEEFTKIVQSYECIRDIVGALGYSRSSGSMAIIVKDRINKLNISTDHLKGRTAKKSSNSKYTLDEILVENSPYENIWSLKKKLIANGLLNYACEVCGNTGEWCGKPLVLQLHHKNGNHRDHRLNNLCFLCPNCHTQTDTFSNRNSEKYLMQLKPKKIRVVKELHKCKICGITISSKAQYCKKCSARLRAPIVRRFEIDRDTLKGLIRNTPFTTIAKQFGVSDQAIRKRCRFFNLPYKTTDILQISNDIWETL